MMGTVRKNTEHVKIISNNKSKRFLPEPLILPPPRIRIRQDDQARSHQPGFRSRK
jgi:hypothetical protein